MEGHVSREIKDVPDRFRFMSQSTWLDLSNYLMANIHKQERRHWRKNINFIFQDLMEKYWHLKCRGSQTWEHLLLTGRTGNCLRGSLIDLKLDWR